MVNGAEAISCMTAQAPDVELTAEDFLARPAGHQWAAERRFPDGSDDLEARAVRGRCPVRFDCVRCALTDSSPHGVWAPAPRSSAGSSGDGGGWRNVGQDMTPCLHNASTSGQC